MRNHDYAEGLVEEHPAISGLQPFLERNHVPQDTIDFLSRRTFFAYPKTLWIKLNVDIEDRLASEDMSLRHSLNPEQIGKALGDWLLAEAAIKNVVFDLTNVTIFDTGKMLGLFRATGSEPGGDKYYVCDGELAESLRRIGNVRTEKIFASQKALLSHLRDIPESQRCVVHLPKTVDLESLDEALKEDAAPKKLKKCDAIAFDMSRVSTIAFQGHSMLSPTIHSLAHSYGILATVIDPKSKVVTDIMAHGTLRAMRSNLIQVPQTYIRRLEPPDSSPGVFAMHAFTRDESVQVQELTRERLDEMFVYYDSWLASVAKVPEGLGQRSADRFKPVVKQLRNVIKELIDNVAGHANGLGYVMMELNPLPRHGLSIYVGDTGIGLARGIERSYKMENLTDRKAVEMAMCLGDQLKHRRRLPGTLAFGGRGLEHVGVMLKKLSGTIWIRSGEAMATFSPGDTREPIEVKDGLYYTQGTHIHIKIPTRWEALK